MGNQGLWKRVSLGAALRRSNITEAFHPNQLLSFTTTYQSADGPYFHRSIVSLSGFEQGVRYIAKPSILAALFSYRRATSLTKRAVTVRRLHYPFECDRRSPDSAAQHQIRAVNVERNP